MHHVTEGARSDPFGLNSGAGPFGLNYRKYAHPAGFDPFSLKCGSDPLQAARVFQGRDPFGLAKPGALKT